MLLITRYYLHNHSKEDNTYVACSLHIVKKKWYNVCLEIGTAGTTWETWDDNVMSVFERNRMGGLN
jgi:hypothetical protein